jgi:hypothetical protein
MNKENQLKSIEQFTNELFNFLQDKLPRSGALAETLEYTYDSNSMHIDTLPYFDFVEDGVNGTETNWGSPFSFTDKMPPIASIEDYANSIGINVFALQRTIFRKGIEPANVITPTFDNRVGELADNFSEAVWDDFADEQVNKKNFKKK